MPHPSPSFKNDFLSPAKPLALSQDDAFKIIDVRRSMAFVDDLLSHVTNNDLHCLAPENLSAFMRVMIAALPELEL